MNNLSTKLALVLVATFMILAMLLLFAAQVETVRERLPSLQHVTGLLAATLTLVWFVLQPLLRRIGRLVAALESLGREPPFKPLTLPGADAQGDELARLAAQTERVAQQLADQSSALAGARRQGRELLANVSHDLRTPLASMHGYLELLLLRHGSLAPAEANNYLQTATRQSERLSVLVADLFELSRLEADDMRPQTEGFALAELAQDVVHKHGPEAQRRELRLGTSGDASAGVALEVQADIGLIERVLDNLVDNALRHTPAGGTVTIDIARHAQHARVTVCDTGHGIASEDLPGIFERYERASRVGAANDSSHAGLGLAIARRIANLHGSQLHVHSTPGQGTRVSFDLALVTHPMRIPVSADQPRVKVPRHQQGGA